MSRNIIFFFFITFSFLLSADFMNITILIVAVIQMNLITLLIK